MGTRRAPFPRPPAHQHLRETRLPHLARPSCQDFRALKCSDVRRAFFYMRNEIIFSLLSGSCQKTWQIKGFEREGLGRWIRARGWGVPRPQPVGPCGWGRGAGGAGGWLWGTLLSIVNLHIYYFVLLTKGLALGLGRVRRAGAVGPGRRLTVGGSFWGDPCPPEGVQKDRHLILSCFSVCPWTSNMPHSKDAHLPFGVAGRAGGRSRRKAS